MSIIKNHAPGSAVEAVACAHRGDGDVGGADHRGGGDSQTGWISPWLLVVPCGLDGFSYNETMRPAEIIPAFDAFLARQGVRFEAVILGGSALALLGVVKRETRDCDVMHPVIPPGVANAAREFAADMRGRGIPLDNEWFNDKPGPLKDNLPAGWETRMQTAYTGRALILHTLCRLDLIRSKVFAYCDRLTDLADCIALAPTRRELEQITPWLEQQDGNPTWPEHVRATLRALERELGRSRSPGLER